MSTRFHICLLSLALLLGGCASADPQNPDSCAISPATGNVIYSDLLIPIYLLYGLGCEGVRALNHHGAFTPAPKGEVRDGVYRPADGRFSIAAPPGLEIREQLSQDRDYVFFTPRFSKGPGYGLVVDLELDREYAALSLDEYASLALRDARLEQQRVTGAPLTRLRHEMVTLDGNPALFELYSQSQAGKPTAYYLMYFLKLQDRAAILSIAWPGDCPACTAGPEQEIRTMDPALQRFVESFHFADVIQLR